MSIGSGSKEVTVDLDKSSYGDAAGTTVMVLRGEWEKRK